MICDTLTKITFLQGDNHRKKKGNLIDLNGAKFTDMKKILYSTLFLLLAFSNQSCVTEAIIQEMVNLDRAYIPALYYAKHKDKAKSRSALILLHSEWQKLTEKSRRSYLTKEWQDALARIEGYLGKATSALNQNDFYWTVCQLENARFEWNDLRKTNGMTYYIDYIYEFQMAWDVVEEVINDPVLCWLEWQEFENQVQIAKKAWEKLNRKEVEWQYFNPTKEELAHFEQYKKNLEVAMKAFLNDVTMAEREYIALSSLEVSKQLNNLTNIFGNFSEANPYIAAAF